MTHGPLAPLGMATAALLDDSSMTRSAWRGAVHLPAAETSLGAAFNMVQATASTHLFTQYVLRCTACMMRPT
jgi:hypothetical protein